MYHFKQTTAVIILVIAGITLNAQTTNFQSHIVDNDFAGPAGIYATDIDNDGIIDIVSAGADANTIAWWQNDGNSPVVWTKHIVDDNFATAIYVTADDINGDGHMDILAAGWDENELAWWMNNGEYNIEWTKYTVKQSFVNAHEIMAYDIDLDGDLDIIGVSAGLHTISWFENNGGVPVNWIEHIIDTSFGGARSVDASDIDGDGDIDLCGAALEDNEIAWWLNDGGVPINWTKITVTPYFSMSHKIHLTDMDMDGDIDILGTGYLSGISWYRNNGGDSITWDRQIITGNSTTVIAWAVDLDLDSDKDIIASSQGSGYLSYYINEGNNSLDFDFNLLEYFPGAWPLHYGDIDLDGDPDIVSGGNSANEIKWFQNDIITSDIAWIDDSNIRIFFNNISREIVINLDKPIDYNNRLIAYDLSGKKLFTIQLDSKINREVILKLPASVGNSKLIHVILTSNNIVVGSETISLN